MTRPPRQHYDDGMVQLDRHALTLRRYHFPSGTAKVIPLKSIQDYHVESLGLWTQRFRLWGTSDLRRWLPLDSHRPLRSVLITLDVPGGRHLPAFTPAEPEEFLAMFDEVLKHRGRSNGQPEVGPTAPR
jgi:hypothetical protein